MKMLRMLSLLGALAPGTLVCVMAGRSSASDEPRGGAQVPQDPAKSVEERLSRIEQLLEKLVAEKALVAARDDANRRGSAPFRVPQDLPRRVLNSTRSPQAESLANDRDRDGLTDVEEGRLGTDPSNPDSDGDALLDGWEVHGVNGIDLPGMGASPLHKDIFVQMDFMRRDTATNVLAPNDNVLRRIEAVFLAAPVANPDAVNGIKIHLERGNLVDYVDNLQPYMSAFAAIKETHFERARAPVFHYMIWANAYDGGTSSGVSMGIPHSDFIVTLGRWNNNLGGTDLQKIGTFVHELGHNLGRKHGGSEHVNFKPNHLSVMNYSFQTRGIFHNGTRVFDYQRFPLPGLDELALREADGLGGSAALEGYRTIHYGPSGAAFEVPADGAIDWNVNGMIDPMDVAVDLNNDTLLEELLATPDEWEQLIYNGGSIGSLASLDRVMATARQQMRRLPFVELNEETDRRISASRGNGDRARGAPRQGQARPAGDRAPLIELDEEADRRLGEALRRGLEEKERPK